MAKVPVEIFVDTDAKTGVVFCCRVVLTKMVPGTLTPQDEVIEMCGPTIDAASRRLYRAVNDWKKRREENGQKG